MNDPVYLVILENDYWHIVAEDTDRKTLNHRLERTGPSLSDDVELLKTTLIDLDLADGRACLGLPSTFLYSAPISLENLPRRRRRDAMAYRFEEQLPLDVEELVVAFTPAVGNIAQGIAVREDIITPMILEFEASGILIETIRPAAMLTLSGLLQRESILKSYLAIGWDEHIDVLCLEAGRPIDFYTVSKNSKNLHRYFRARLLMRPIEEPTIDICLVGQAKDVPDETIVAFESDADFSLRRINADAYALAYGAVGQAISGQSTVWAELHPHAHRRLGDWQRLARPLKAALAMTWLLMAILSAGLFFRALQYRSVSENHRDAQAQAYRRAFPKSTVPLSIRSRLESEWQKRSAQSGYGMNIPQQISALDTLNRLVTHLPESMRFRITHIRIGASDLSLEGQTRTHTDAETIARSLQNGGFNVEAPRTEHLADIGVDFSLFAKHANLSSDANSTGGSR
jgi:hypothetical protein